MTKIIISPFSQNRDQAACRVPLQNILAEIQANFSQAKPGYREGVILVPVDHANFTGQIRTLQAGDYFTGSYKPRQADETPRKEIRTFGNPDPLVAVDAVLYHRDTLAEGKENSDLSADYEVITFLTKISDAEQPMAPDTLMANHFKSSGGTDTRMNDFELIAALKLSYEFWRNKALVMPAKKSVKTSSPITYGHQH